MGEEDATVGHALLALGIICILILSICIAWLIWLCERYRRKRKYRPGQRNPPNRSSGIVRTGPSPQISRHLLVTKKGTDNLVIANKGFLSKSTPQLLDNDEDDCWGIKPSASPAGSEPLLPTLSKFDSDQGGFSIHQQIAAILSTFPNLSFTSKLEVNEEEGPETCVDDTLLSTFVTSPSSERPRFMTSTPQTSTISIPRPHSSKDKFMTSSETVLPPIALPPNPLPRSLFFGLMDENSSSFLPPVPKERKSTKFLQIENQTKPDLHKEPKTAQIKPDLHNEPKTAKSFQIQNETKPDLHTEPKTAQTVQVENNNVDLIASMEFIDSTDDVEFTVEVIDPPKPKENLKVKKKSVESDDEDDDVFSTILETTL